MKPSGKISASVAFKLLLLPVLLIFNNTCQRFEPEQLVIIETGSVSDVGYKSCTAKGEIYDIGEDGITQHGFCWSETPDPTVENSEMNQLGSSSNTGIFTGIVTGLSVNTTYYIRAYGKNDTRTAYGSENTFKTLTPNSITDYDGNTYQTVVIGDQTWMAENLKTSHYADGTSIPLVEDSATWNTLAPTDKAYCYYDNIEANSNTYGALYNWAATTNGIKSSANPSGIQGVCPDGWHLPSDGEWKQLEMYLGMSQEEADYFGYRGTDEGGKLKESGTEHWLTPNTGATNESGFTALPGGFRWDIDSWSLGLQNDTRFWTTSEDTNSEAWYRQLNRESAQVWRLYIDKSNGQSVRCIKDNLK